jgi:hypothetical protein
MYSIYGKNNKSTFKQNKNLITPIYPRIVSPYVPQNYANNMKSFKEISTMSNFNKSNNFIKISKQVRSLGVKDKQQQQLKFKSYLGHHRQCNFNNNNYRNAENAINIYKSYNFNEIPSYNSLVKLWSEFNISNQYLELFKLVLNKLDDEEKEELCSKEIKELTELKTHIIALLKEIQSRKKILNELSKLNHDLEEMVITEGKDVDEEILQTISENITNLRIYTVNICYRMRKVKGKIAQGYLCGKYNLNLISKKFGFDQNYLVKMKEEMQFLKVDI